MCVCSASAECERTLHLQQLEGVEAIKHPLGQVGDLISIQHAGKSQYRLALDTGNDNRSGCSRTCTCTCTNWARGHLQRVEGAKALEGIRSYLRDLVVAQVSVLQK